jgi:hypothetical protein
VAACIPLRIIQDREEEDVMLTTTTRTAVVERLKLSRIVMMRMMNPLLRILIWMNYSSLMLMMCL